MSDDPQKPSSQNPSNPPQKLAKLARFPSEAEAAVVVSALREAGVHCETGNAASATLLPETFGEVEVLVAAADLPVAQNSLAKLREEYAQLDWSQVDVGDPEQG